MFEDVKGEDMVESIIAEGKGVRVTHHISVSKNLALEFDAIGIVVGGCAGPDMENQAFTCPDDGFEFSSHRIAFMLQGNDLSRFGEEHRNAVLGKKRGGAAFALDRFILDAQGLPTVWTSQDRDQLCPHFVTWRNRTQSTIDFGPSDVAMGFHGLSRILKFCAGRANRDTMRVLTYYCGIENSTSLPQLNLGCS